MLICVGLFVFIPMTCLIHDLFVAYLFTAWLEEKSSWTYSHIVWRLDYILRILTSYNSFLTALTGFRKSVMFSRFPNKWELEVIIRHKFCMCPCVKCTTFSIITLNIAKHWKFKINPVVCQKVSYYQLNRNPWYL